MVKKVSVKRVSERDICQKVYRSCTSSWPVGIKSVVTIINGVGGSGKDTFVKYAKSYVESIHTGYPINVINISSIDTVKEVVSALTRKPIPESEDDGKTDEYRTFLSKIKRAWIDYDSSGSTNAVVSEIFEYNAMCEKKYDALTQVVNIFFVHIREPEEIQKLETALPSDYIKTTLFISRSDIDTPTNESDRMAPDYSYDLWIANNSDENRLRACAKEYIDTQLSRVTRYRCI